MCDMQKLPTEDATCEEESDMNFAAFSAVGGAGTHFVTTGGQLPITKLQQNIPNNGNNMQQVCVAMGDGGVQYVRALDGGATLQTSPQLISVPIALPGAKPGDPQQTVQIQVLNPNMLQTQQQQPKYQMQIPIQGFQQGGAVLTLAYSPENDANGLQLVGQGLGEGLQVVAALPPEMQLVQPEQAENNKEVVQQNIHQVFITPNQQIIIHNPSEQKMMTMNNNTVSDNNNAEVTDIIIKEECDDTMDDESSQGTETSDSIQWTAGSNQQDLIKYLNTLPPQQTQALPASLQQFLRLNPTDAKKTVEIQIDQFMTEDNMKKEEPVAEAVLSEDGTIRIQSRKKKKYKKKPPKPARPKPGQVVIATALDGSPIFCCPECQMAYPEKEQLEVHLLVHKIERRFICGICGAGLKRKEHLDRHRLGHNPERPYVCGVCRKGFKRREHLNLHAVIHSGIKTEMCNECGKGFYRKDHLRKHTRSHETKRAKDESMANAEAIAAANANASANNNTNVNANTNTNANISISNVHSVENNTSSQQVLPEITIHIPSSMNANTPVQINIPQHLVDSLAAQEQFLSNHS